MCISHSVGEHGTNNTADAKVVQALLDANLGSLIPMAHLTVDGQPGTNTRAMIAEFQRRVLHMAKPTSRVDPGDATIRALHAGLAAGLSQDKLRAIMPNATQGRIDRYYNSLVSMMAANGINTPLRMAHFLAQVGHESGDLLYSEELASGDAYNGRTDLGNTHPGDGPRYKGRGLIQLTGRSNYAAFGVARHRDFLAPPHQLLLSTDASLAVDVSCWFWTTHGLNALADADNLNTITRRINGGVNGLADRAAHLQRAKCLLVP